MKLTRLLRHLFTSHWTTRKAFSREVLQAIESEILAGERRHGGEIRFAVEGSLDAQALFRGVTPRERALQMFAHLRVWDTAENNGVLIYLLQADRDVEIVADRGFNGRVSTAEWESICRGMEEAFRAGEYRRGVVEGIAAASSLIAKHFPAVDRNELPDTPIVM